MTLEVAQPSGGSERRGPAGADAPAGLRVPRAAKPGWFMAYRRRLLVSDALVIVCALAASNVIRFGARDPSISGVGHRLGLSYAALGGVLGLAWIVSLSLADSRNMKILGAGGEEYRRVIRAGVGVFATVAIISYLAGFEVARGYLGVAAPIGLVLLLLERGRWRRWLTAQRRRGESTRRTVVIGSPADVAHISAEIGRVPAVGLRVVGVCTPAPPAGLAGAGTPSSLDDVEEVLSQVRAGGVDAVIVASGGDQARQTVRQLGWALEGTGVSLMIAPSLVEVAGNRIHIQPVAGLTVMHVEEPRLPRGGQLLKAVFDRIGAALLILVLSPLLLAVGLAVRLTSPGPALFRQERIGRGGTIFRIWKFRSMHVDADRQLQTLLHEAGRDGTPLFKLDHDPRVTPLGAVLRKYSLDELPQLFNVLAGPMSLVGPRPQRAAEVELYDDVARRRLLAKPGMTGLWQVSGRSDLPWHEAISRDVYYVENWSFTFDLLLLWKTIWTVIRGVGAR